MGISSSIRVVVPGLPGFRLVRSIAKSSADSNIPAGTPSNTMPTAGPCDSPYKLTLKSLPVEFNFTRCI